MRVLAADVGGTKTAVAIVEIDGGALSLLREERYASAEHAQLEEILADFLSTERRPPSAAGLGVAGPVQDGRARVTKLPWNIDERRLSRRFRSISSFRLVNDFVANALGLPYLKPRQLRTLARGRPEPNGPRALIGAGTGLGQAGLLSVAGRYEPFPSEGGHKDFAARDAREARLAAFVRRRTGRSEWDVIVCGEGLGHIYDFLREEGGRERPAVRDAFANEDDRAAVISRFGLPGSDRLCRDALALFVSLYGSEAGNVALQYRATGGLYVAGGIAPKILPALEQGGFLKSFTGKPPLTRLLERIPVRIVLEPRLGLYGAAAAGYRTAMEMTRPSSKRSVRLTTA
jgi:glucokinase